LKAFPLVEEISADFDSQIHTLFCWRGVMHLEYNDSELLMNVAEGVFDVRGVNT